MGNMFYLDMKSRDSPLKELARKKANVDNSL